MARARMTSKGQITVPKEVRERLRVGPGDALDFVYAGDHLEVRPIRRRRFEDFRGLFPIARAVPFDEERRLAWTAQTRRLIRKKSTRG